MWFAGREVFEVENSAECRLAMQGLQMESNESGAICSWRDIGSKIEFSDEQFIFNEFKS